MSNIDLQRSDLICTGQQLELYYVAFWEQPFIWLLPLNHSIVQWHLFCMNNEMPVNIVCVIEAIIH